MFESLIKSLEEKIVNNEELEFVEVINSEGATPRGVGAFLFVDKNKNSYGTIGGGLSEFKAITYANELLLEKKDDIKVFDMTLGANANNEMICGGKNTVKFTFLSNDKKTSKLINELKNKFVNKSIVYIFGAGHIAMELGKLLTYAGFEYVIYDDRKEFVIKENFKDAKELYANSYEDINDILDIKNEDYVIIVTSGHMGDYIVEKEVLRKKPYYIGCIGSSTKTKIVNDKLKVSGFCDKELEKVYAPIGIQIGAETPEEIAISIVSELILHRAKMENRKKFVDKKTIFDCPYTKIIKKND